MGQHEDFGAWFACIAAGYGLSCASRFTTLRSVRYAAAALAAASVTALGVHYAKADHVIDITTGRRLTTVSAMDALSRPYLHLSGRKIPDERWIRSDDLHRSCEHPVVQPFR